MKRAKIALVLMSLAGVLFGQIQNAWAPGIIGPPPCVTDDPRGPEMSGTVGVEASNVSGGVGSFLADFVDATLWLKWQDQEKVFRVRLPGPNYQILTKEQLSCDILAALQSTILTEFGIAPTNSLKLCFSTMVPGPLPEKITCESISQFTFDEIEETGNFSGLAIASRIFVMD